MPKLHEILASAKVPESAWKAVQPETLKKFKAADTYFHGHSKSLKMLDSDENAASRLQEEQQRSEKPVASTVMDTLVYALDLFGKAEDMQLMKNRGNISALGTIMWRGKPLVKDVPVDSLMGLEKRLQEVKQLIAATPTLDASKEWEPAPQIGEYVWQAKYPDVTTKTAKIVRGVQLSPATKEHAAQVQAVAEDVPVGKFTTVHRSGECTTAAKAYAIQQIDELITEVKQARVRTNETTVQPESMSLQLIQLILEPFSTFVRDNR